MEKLLIGIHEFSPLVKNDRGSWKGFEIELWEKIAENLDIQFEYKEEKNFEELLNKTSAGEYQLAISGISRTLARKEKLDMSFLTVDSGLMILSRRFTKLSFRALFENVFNSGLGKIIFVLFSLAFIAANIFWVLERGQSVSLEYLPGLFESFWWAVVTFSTVGYGDIAPLGIAGKMFGIFAIMVGLAVFGLYIGNLSAALAVERSRSEIDGADDLEHSCVGTKAGTTSELYLKEHQIKTKVYGTIKDAYKGLIRKDVDAVVFDGPVLRHDVKKMKKDVVLLGDTFARQSYSFIAPKGSEELIDKINREIIKVHENEEYDELHKKYFG